MKQTKHLVIVAGEESGDQHAAALVRQLKQNHSDLDISGIGGQHMNAAGVHLLSDLARFGVTGFIEVARHMRVISKAYRLMCEHLKNTKPDLLILIDYPGFNLRLAKFAKQTLGIKILYYISPQIWAWKPKRIEIIRRCVDHMAVILPFEKILYEKEHIPVSFVGHPLVERINRVAQTPLTRAMFELPDEKKIIALLPGSRINEIERHMPILCDTAQRLNQQFTNLHFVIPIANTIEPDMIKSYWTKDCPPCSFIQGSATELIALSDCVVVGSGTASLECALLGKPMCIIYKASLLTYLIASKVIRVNYLGLCNLLTNRMIVPELLQYDCNAKELTSMLTLLLNDTKYTQHMQSELKQLKHQLSSEKADLSLYELVEEKLYF